MWIKGTWEEVKKLAYTRLPKELTAGRRRWRVIDSYYDMREGLFYLQLSRVTKHRDTARLVVIRKEELMRHLEAHSPVLYSKQVLANLIPDVEVTPNVEV